MAIEMDTTGRNLGERELLLGLERLSDAEWKQIIWDLEEVVNDLDYGEEEGRLPILVDGVAEPVGYIKVTVDMPHRYDECEPFKAELNLYVENLDPSTTINHLIGEYTLFRHPSLFWFDEHGGFARIKAQISYTLSSLPNP